MSRMLLKWWSSRMSNKLVIYGLVTEIRAWLKLRMTGYCLNISHIIQRLYSFREDEKGFPRQTAIKFRLKKQRTKQKLHYFWKGSNGILVPVPDQSHPLRGPAFLWATSQLSHGEEGQSGCQGADRRLTWLRQLRTGCRVTPGWRLLRPASGVHCGSLPPVVHLEGECFRDDKEQENKNSHTRKRKVPLTKAHRTHDPSKS